MRYMCALVPLYLITIVIIWKLYSPLISVSEDVAFINGANAKHFDIFSTYSRIARASRASAINFTEGRRFRTGLQRFQRILAVHKSGQLGNQIFEYMSLFVVWKTHLQALKEYNFVPVIDNTMKMELETLFESYRSGVSPTSIANVYPVWEIPLEKPVHFPEHQHFRERNWNIILSNYSARYEDIFRLGFETVREELRIQKRYVKEVRRRLLFISRKFGVNAKTTTFIGMHYRGGDYITHMNNTLGSYNGPVDYRYYMTAMKFFEMKYSDVVFIFISTDYHWLRRNIDKIRGNGRVIINPFKRDKMADLVLLSYCNHSIINYGTYGATAALFANGTTIVYDLGVQLDYRGPTIAMGIQRILPYRWFLGNESVVKTSE